MTLQNQIRFNYLNILGAMYNKLQDYKHKVSNYCFE